MLIEPWDGLAVKIACWSLKYHGFDRKLIRSLVGKRVGRLWGEPVKVGANRLRWGRNRKGGRGLTCTGVNSS